MNCSKGMYSIFWSFYAIFYCCYFIVIVFNQKSSRLSFVKCVSCNAYISKLAFKNQIHIKYITLQSYAYRGIVLAVNAQFLQTWCNTDFCS